jgi:exopolysaccharide biosynthesis polyprenyl glycosylphosphotransferase
MIGLGAERLRAVTVAGDAALAALAWPLAAAIRTEIPLPFTRGLLPPERVVAAPWAPVIGLAILLVALDLLGLYSRGEPRARLDLLVRIEAAVWGAGAGLATALFVTDQDFARSLVLLAVGLQAVALPAWRLLLGRWWRPRRRRVLLVGDGALATELAASIATRGWHGLEVAGYVPSPGTEPNGGDRRALGPRLGELCDVPRIVAAGLVDEVILAVASPSWKTELIDSLADLGGRRAGVLLVPDPFESLIGRLRYRWVHDIPMIEVVRREEWSPSRPLKRALDLAGASLLGLLALPAFAAVALAVRLGSAGPVIYRQRRVGRDRSQFELLKFRTMSVDAEADGAERLATPGDERITRVGSFLRRTRLDELPQLINVLRGDMSLVGPRPERPGFVARYLEEVPGYGERFAVRPGVTGLAQVVGDYHTTAENKLRYDLAYIANQNLRLDLSILFRTVRTVLSTSGT